MTRTGYKQRDLPRTDGLKAGLVNPMKRTRLALFTWSNELTRLSDHDNETLTRQAGVE